MNICIVSSSIIISYIGAMKTWHYELWEQQARFLLLSFSWKPIHAQKWPAIYLWKPWWLESGPSWPGLQIWELGIRNWELLLLAADRSVVAVLYVDRLSWPPGQQGLASLLINFCSRQSIPNTHCPWHTSKLLSSPSQPWWRWTCLISQGLCCKPGCSQKFSRV